MKKNNYIYPTHIDDCTLENWDACLECRHWDNCERKEAFRKIDILGWALIILSSIFVSAVVAYLVGVL